MKTYWPNFQKRGGLIIVAVQDATTKEILMVAFTDEAGFLETLRSGEAVYFSTSRKKRWKKGETESGAFQIVRDILVDCDGDTVVYVVDQLGDGACHTKAASCFYRRVVGAVQIAPAPDAGEKERLEIKDVDACERFHSL